MTYEVMTLVPMPTGNEHMGAVEMGLEPTRQAFAATLEDARNMAAGIVHGFEITLERTLGDAYSKALTLPEEGRSIDLPDGAVVLVRPYASKQPDLMAALEESLSPASRDSQGTEGDPS